MIVFKYITLSSAFGQQFHSNSSQDTSLSFMTAESRSSQRPARLSTRMSAASCGKTCTETCSSQHPYLCTGLGLPAHKLSGSGCKHQLAQSQEQNLRPTSRICDFTNQTRSHASFRAARLQQSFRSAQSQNPGAQGSLGIHSPQRRGAQSGSTLAQPAGGSPMGEPGANMGLPDAHRWKGRVGRQEAHRAPLATQGEG